MSESNQHTIEAYNKEADIYLFKTPSVYQPYHKRMLDWIEASLKDLNQDTIVLEIGSGTPRDANYIRGRGFKVQTSDASKKFVEQLRAADDNAILFNALNDPVPGKYGLIFANAVAPHFTRDDMDTFITKMYSSLDPGERLAFNLKIGYGEGWINEKLTAKRFTHYWQPDEIKQLLAGYGFKLIFFDSDANGDLPSHHWINIVVQK